MTERAVHTAVLSELREPPVLGKFYMVPVMRAHDYCGISGMLPVLGPAHTDVEHFNFKHRHYHVDTRFLRARERAAMARYWPSKYVDEFGTAGALPLSNNSYGGLPNGLPALARRKCTAVASPYRHGEQAPVKALRKDFGEPDAIMLADGRKLCPHRKVDLSSFAPDADGKVTCPLHGLRVCVAIATARGEG